MLNNKKTVGKKFLEKAQFFSILSGRGVVTPVELPESATIIFTRFDSYWQTLNIF